MTESLNRSFLYSSELPRNTPKRRPIIQSSARRIAASADTEQQPYNRVSYKVDEQPNMAYRTPGKGVLGETSN
jgi:hypothetical protein